MTEQRWEMVAGVEMVRRPIETAPAEVDLCFVDNGGAFAVARRRKGEWDNAKGRPLKLEPTHWTIWASGDPLAKAANDG